MAVMRYTQDELAEELRKSEARASGKTDETVRKDPRRC